MFILVNLFCQFLVLDYPHNSMGNTRLLRFSQPFWGIYPLFLAFYGPLIIFGPLTGRRRNFGSSLFSVSWPSRSVVPDGQWLPATGRSHCLEDLQDQKFGRWERRSRLDWEVSELSIRNPQKLRVLCGFLTPWRNLDASHEHRSNCCRRLGSIPVGTRNLEVAFPSWELLLPIKSSEKPFYCVYLK